MSNHAITKSVPVWDVFVRLFHWSLVAAMAWEFIGRSGNDLHEIVGYFILGLVGLRIIWGFIGTRYARFASFVVSPRNAIGYLLSVVTGHPARHLGHNPAGGAMVILLLAFITATAVSGWAMTTDALWGSEWIEELHEGLANITMVMIFVHVAGVILASLQHRENLVRAMVTGRKRP